MNIVDVAVVLLIVVSAILGYRSGLIQSVFSLAGLIFGLAIASWNYQRFGNQLAVMVHSEALAEAIWFCLLTLAGMVLAGLLGMLIRKAVRAVGLGWVDRLAGLLFGLLRGAVLVVVCIVVLAAFFPDTRSLGDARLAKYFLGTAHLTTHMTPDELKQRILYGLRVLESDAPTWLHPN